ncbi:MAG: hypothetical protein ACLQHF_10310 [Terracidiphilus sp.]
MRPSIVLAIALLSGSLPLAAQQGSAGATASQGPVVNIPKNFTVSPTITIYAQQAANCPVALNASHLADGSMIRTAGRAGSAHPNGIGQWLHITVMTPTVSTAQLKVRGYSDKAHMTQTGSKNGPDAVRTVIVSFRDMPNGQTEGNVWVPGLTAVDSLYLISLTYVDGTSWNAPGGQECRVTPDPLMLISGR